MTTATATATRPTPSDLTGCDRCSARALYLYVLPSGLDLALCGHHSHDHGVQLVAGGAAVQSLDN